MKRLITVRLTKRVPDLVEELFDAIAAARVAGTDPVVVVAPILDEAVAFGGWLGVLVEDHVDESVFGFLAGLVVELVDASLARGRREAFTAPPAG